MKKWYPNEEPHEREVRIRVHPGGKTLKELWEENNKKSRFFVMSTTNQTPKYELLSISSSKNLAILSRRGRGIRGYFKKYYDLFVLDNPRWFRL